MNKLITISLLLMIAATSCKKGTTTTASITKADRLVFGVYNPMCATAMPCGRFYLLQNTNLSPDQTYYMTPNPFALTVLPDSLYQVANVLRTGFPAYFVQHGDSVIGCPGCADGDVVRLWATVNGTLIKRDVNSDTSQIPAEIRNYIWQVEHIEAELP